MNQVQRPRPNGSQTEKLVYFPRSDGSRIPYKVYSSQELYDLEQERIFRGPVWKLRRIGSGDPEFWRLQEHVRRRHSRGGHAQ